MHKKSKNQVVSLFYWELSRKGGVQEVSRLVASALCNSGLYRLRCHKVPQKNISLFFYKIFLRKISKRNQVLFFMHPYLFEHLRDCFVYQPTSPTIVWAHGIEVWGNFGKNHSLSLATTTKIIASSNFTRDRILENFPTADVSVARLAVHTKPSFHCIEESKPFEILTVGRLAGEERYKGHDIVIKALAILKNKGIKLKYHIVGTGPDLSRLERLTQDMGLEGQVVFHGYLPDSKTEQVYAQSSVFVMPSHVIRRDKEIWSGEGFGLVYLEAATHALPVIACDEGGQCDCIIDGETGFLVKPDPALVADRIHWLVENKPASIQMGERGRNFVLSNFTFEHFQQDVLNVIDQAIAKKNLNSPLL